MSLVNYEYKSILMISLFGIITVVVLNIPEGYYILYPFMILGTWFHEFSHGLTAIILGGDFHRLVLFPDGSGYAEFSYSSLFLGPIGNALVAAAGPIGPTIIGSIFLVSSTNNKVTMVLLYTLAITILLSTVIWVRPIIGFGFFISLIFSVVFFIIAIKGNIKFKQLTVQFIGIQAFASLYLSIGYLFSSGAIVGGTRNMSDTQVIAENLFLPYWIWAVLIVTFSIYLLVKSFLIIIKNTKSPSIVNRNEKF